MSHTKLALGCLTFFLATAGLITSFQAVNETIPPEISRAETSATQLPARKEDRLQLIAAKVENSHEAAPESEPHLNRLCVSLEGRPFAWDWPNVPFATMTCDDQRRK
jgi:hypothetical protein